MRYTRLLPTVVIAGLAALTVGVAARAQTPDPYVGTWTLDVAKSSFKPGPAPKSTTVVAEAAGKGLKVSVDAVGADGTPMKWGYTTMRDGKDVPVTGNPNYDTVAWTQHTPTTVTAEYKKGGKVVTTSKTSVSADGKTVTLTSSGPDPKGQAVNIVAVYTKK
jgi:hypothetical protein